MHAILTPDGHCIFLSQPYGWMGVCSEFTQVSQVKQLDFCTLNCIFDQTIQNSCLFIHSIVSGIKPQVKLSRYQNLISSGKKHKNESNIFDNTEIKVWGYKGSWRCTQFSMLRYSIMCKLKLEVFTTLWHIRERSYHQSIPGAPQVDHWTCNCHFDSIHHHRNALVTENARIWVFSEANLFECMTPYSQELI